MDYRKTDPAFMERAERFAFEEVPAEEGQQLDAPTRWLAILAALVGCQGLDAYKAFLVRVVSQSLPYIGYPRSLNAITCINKAAE